MSDFDDDSDDFGLIIAPEHDAQPKGRHADFNKVAVPLETLPESKSFMADTINAYAMGNLPRDRLRNIIYSMNVYLGYLKLEIDQQLLVRIEALEEKLREVNK
jgi:hypothetical protein